jgi:ribokinase
MESSKLKFDPSRLRFDSIIGTGGIGSGKFFVLNGDHTLGREESRSGHFLDIKDYCKQHIILHYVKKLLGVEFKVIPVGKVGDDDTGRILYNEMEETGFVMKHIKKVPGLSTLFSFCYYYPDGSGGNLTTDNSASSTVDEEYIEEVLSEIRSLGSRGIIMAAPEVPLAARQKLIRMGSDYGLFCTASFTTEEISQVLETDLLEKTDLVSINIDEAAAVGGYYADNKESLAVIKKAISKLQQRNPKILVSVTAGREGSWCFDGGSLNWFPAIQTDPVSTAGAGDAFFSGIISGLALGLHIFDAQQLASLVAGLSVCSPDTIHKGIGRKSLNQFMMSCGTNFSETILKLMED